MKENSKYVIFSINGPHASEDSSNIFARKIDDIIKTKTGQTFWYERSSKAKPGLVQKLCAEAIKQNCNPLCLFFPGGEQTKSSDRALKYSSDLSTWHPLPEGLGPVTGTMDKNAYALIFDKLEVGYFGEIDLWEYADFYDLQSTINTMRPHSTVCGIRREKEPFPIGMKSHIRKVIAKGRLVSPYAVWLR